MQKHEWEKIVVAARKHAGNDKIPLWSAMVSYYSVCVSSLVTELSFTLWDLYQRIDGTKNETYRSYYDLPAFWVSACGVIEKETNRIDKIKEDKNQRQQRQLLRRLGNRK